MQQKTNQLASRCLAVAGLATGFSLTVAAQTFTQSITLQPGWNAVWLEVEPEDNATDLVFSNLPVASVWTRLERVSSVEFIQSVSEAAFNEAGWQRWFPADREESFLNNLFAVQANRAYLLHCTNGAPVVWNLDGRPSLRQPDWIPDSYNLRGLPVDPAAPPTFVNFFRESPAHYSSTSGQLQKMYRLNSASGQWQLVAATDPVQSGAAYWIFTQGASGFLAPLNVDVDIGDGLDFDADLTELDLTLKNLRTGPINALVHDLAGMDSILARYSFDPVQGGAWPALSSPLPVALAGGAEATVRLAARRQDLSAPVDGSVMEIRDGAGTRVLVPVRVENPAVTAIQGDANQAQGISDPMAGLWVGSVKLEAVSEVHSANPTNPTPVQSSMSLRLILHVDSGGQVRLLKEVIQMWRDGTFTNDGSGNLLVDQPGGFVLLTDDTLIPFFGGATLRDGESVGRRLSTIGYDFPSTPTNNFLNLTGSFVIGSGVQGVLMLPHDHPTNPFKHRYHPDHDNLNARFDGPAVEAFDTTRAIALDFLASPPGGPAVPDFGYNEMGGNYHEVVTGIHRNPIHVSGTFRLSRVSRIAGLNPDPTP